MPILSKRRKVRLTQHRTVDSPFGPVRISHDRWPAVVALVQGPGVPDVTVLPGRDLGGMSIGGQRVPLKRQSRNWDPRWVARTRTALVGDRAYELRPTGPCRGRLLRDARVIADARGSLASYLPFRDVPGIDATLTWYPGVDPTDVAVGQAMVVAFGAGAPGALASLTLFWLDWLS